MYVKLHIIDIFGCLLWLKSPGSSLVPQADDIALTRLLAEDLRFKDSTEVAVREGREAFRDYRDLILSRLANYRCRILDMTGMSWLKYDFIFCTLE